MLGEYGTNIKIARQLKRYENKVIIDDVNRLEEDKKKVRSY